MSSVEERVKKIVAEQLSTSEDQISNTSSFVDDLGADSLDTVELVMALEEEFGISATNDVDSKTVNKLLLFETLMDDGECKTIDFFDESLGVLKNKEEPTRAEFACSLLREVLLALTEPSVLREKVKLGALLLHLSTATQEFDWLYQYYHQVIDCGVIDRLVATTREF